LYSVAKLGTLVIDSASPLLLLVVGTTVVWRLRAWWKQWKQYFRFDVHLVGAGNLSVKVTNNGKQDKISLQVVRVRGVYGGNFAFPLQIGWDESNAVHAKIAKHDSRTAYIGRGAIQNIEQVRGGGVLVQRPVSTFSFHTPAGERVATQSVSFANDKGVGHLWEFELRAVALSDGRATTFRAHLYLSESPSARSFQAGRLIPGIDPYLSYARLWTNADEPEPWV
jgi:hypothetical protein